MALNGTNSFKEYWLLTTLQIPIFRLQQQKEKHLLDYRWRVLVRIHQMHNLGWMFIKAENFFLFEGQGHFWFFNLKFRTCQQVNGATPKASDALSGELWEVKKERIRKASVYGILPGWDLRSVSPKMMELFSFTATKFCFCFCFFFLLCFPMYFLFRTWVLLVLLFPFYSFLPFLLIKLRLV